MKRFAVIIISIILVLPLSAQKPISWQEMWQQMVSTEDLEEEEWEEYYERLQQLSEQPLNLNRATREDLEQLPFLTAQQIVDLVEYLDRYRPIRSMNELKMVVSMDYRQLALMPFFTYVGEEVQQTPRFPTLSQIGKNGRHTLIVTGRVPFYERKGDENGYLGYNMRHSLRYEFSYGNYLKAGLIGAQDAGEPFFANRNAMGYDYYSYYLQLRRLGIIENAIIGKYKLSSGMGIVLNNSFMLGKIVTLENLGRQTNTLRPHSSRSESDYFQGAAATIRLSKPLALTAFVSHRPMDATLNNDGTAATLITNGYHRTQSEMDKKYNIHLTATGLSVNWRHEGLRIGANAVYTSIDHSLEPNRQILYRRHYAHGRHFMNAGLDYAYYHYRFTLSGETALNQDGAVATINSVTYQPQSSLGIIALQRFYSYRYTGLYSHSFSDGGHTQNESGVYLGINWSPLTYLSLQGYADYAYSPWARYQVSQSSDAWDFLLQANWHKGCWDLQGRYRLRLREKDNEEKSALIPHREQRLRFFATYTSLSEWSLKTQLDLTRSAYQETNHGWMVSEHFSYHRPLLQLNIVTSYFDTDGYASRIYIYERQMQHDFSFPMYYGNGLHLSLFARTDILKNPSISVRLGYTNYFNQSTIGSGLQQIDASHQTDLDVQLRWHF